MKVYTYDEYSKVCFGSSTIICDLHFLNDHWTSVQAEASESEIMFVCFLLLLSFMQSHFRCKKGVISCDSALQLVTIFSYNYSTRIVFLLNRFRTTRDLSQDSRSEKCVHLACGMKQRARVMDRGHPFPLVLQLLRKV
jgi:hypothetical protein